MGLFSDFFGSNSHSQTTTSTSRVTNTQLAGGDIGGPALYGSNGNYINVTDQGAVIGGLLAATDISDHALELGRTEMIAGSAVAIAGLSHASDAYTSSLALVGDVTRNTLNTNYGLARDSTDAVSTFAGKALDSVNRFGGAALDANTYIAGKSLDAVSQAFSDSLSTVANTSAKAMTGVEDLAAQVSQSNQQNNNETVQKVFLYLAIAIVAIFIVPRLVK